MKYRIIGTTPKDGSLDSETITWIDANDKNPAEDFCPNGHSVYIDEIVNVDLPGSFPVGTTFIRMIP